MYCKRCGRELDDSFKVCPYCGEPVNDEPLLNNQDYQIYENMNNNSLPHLLQYIKLPPILYYYNYSTFLK